MVSHSFDQVDPLSRRRINGPVIIGAGPSGLAVGAGLKEQGVPFIILERADCTASLWQLKTYDRLKLHLPRQFFQLPNFPFPEDFPEYPTKNQFINYLESYAQHFDIHPNFNESVQSAKYDESFGLWRVIVSPSNSISNHVAPAEVEYICRWLVVATGDNSDKVVPTFEGLEAFGGNVMHACDYKSAVAYSGNQVLVVGCGNSGMEVSLDLCNHNASPSMVVRSSVHVLPGAETRLSAIKQRMETTGHIRGRAIYRMLVRPLSDHLERLSTTMVGGDQSVQGNSTLDLLERLYERILEIPPQGSEFECCDHIYLDLEDLKRRIDLFVGAGFLNGRPQNIGGQILSPYLDSEIFGNGNDYHARVSAMMQNLNTASHSGLIISRILVHQLSLQLQRLPETVAGTEDHSAQRNEALDLLEKLYEMATQIPPGDEEYAAGEKFHLELPRLVKCIGRIVDDGGLLHETVSVLGPEKIIGNENVTDVQSEVEASRKSEMKVQKKDSGAEDKGKQIRQPLNRLNRVEKQVTDVHEMVKDQKESAAQEKEKIQHLQVDVEDLKQKSSETAKFKGKIEKKVNTIVKEANEKFKSKAKVEEIEGLKQQLANLESTEETLEKKMKELVSSVELQKLKAEEDSNKLKSEIDRKLQELELQKLEPEVQNILKNLVCGQDLKKLESEVNQKLKKLAYGFVRVLVLVVLFGAMILRK